MAAYEGRRCLKSCPTYHQATSCSCGQPGDSAYRQKRPNEDLDASEDVYMETQSRVVGLRADNLRLRIAHLRRMGDLAMERADFQKPMAHRFKLYRFAKRCDTEITRLTQPR